MIRVRPYQPADRAFVLGLAARLMIGMPHWRDPQACLAAVQGWLTGSIAQHGQDAMIFIAEDDRSQQLGVAAVTSTTHFTGERHASVRELATSEAAEGAGVGAALIAACEQWARDQGYRILTLTNGAANERALGFYHHLGYRDEDVPLVKLLSEAKENHNS